MQNSRAGRYRTSMGRGQILDDETNLSLSRGLGRLGLVESEMQVRTIVPGIRRVSTGKPAITHHVAASFRFIVSSLVKIDAKCVSIQGG